MAVLGVIESRWSERYGPGAIAGVRRSLLAVVDQIDVELPDYLPVNGGYGGRVTIPLRPLETRVELSADLPALLAKVLLVFTLDFERGAALALVACANPVRVLDEPRPVRDLPRLTGVAKETSTVLLNSLVKREMFTVEGTGRAKLARLTRSGEEARRYYVDRVEALERAWEKRFSTAVVADLRQALDDLVVDTALARSPLAAAVEPPAGCWRAHRPRPEVLPHHPVVSHRGGYPDGS